MRCLPYRSLEGPPYGGSLLAQAWEDRTTAMVSILQMKILGMSTKTTMKVFHINGTPYRWQNKGPYPLGG